MGTWYLARCTTQRLRLYAGDRLSARGDRGGRGAAPHHKQKAQCGPRPGGLQGAAGAPPELRRDKNIGHDKYA